MRERPSGHTSTDLNLTSEMTFMADCHFIRNTTVTLGLDFSTFQRSELHTTVNLPLTSVNLLLTNVNLLLTSVNLPLTNVNLPLTVILRCYDTMCRGALSVTGSVSRAEHFSFCVKLNCSEKCNYTSQRCRPQRL